jgi:transposase
VPETRRQFTAEFWKGAVRIARETGRPIAQIARALGINAGTRGNWVAGDHSGRGDLLQSAGSSSPDRRPPGLRPRRSCRQAWTALKVKSVSRSGCARTVPFSSVMLVGVPSSSLRWPLVAKALRSSK